MRPLKFRVWDTDNKKMYYDGGQSSTNDGNCCIHSFWNFYLPRHQHHLNKEIMQYTGLQDKNGKEIYEGDIVRTSYGLYRRPTVIDDLESWYFNRVEFSWSSADMEVLGNIYENPELLEKKNES